MPATTVRPRPGAPAAVIRTPDQRVRVFASSTLQELAPERQAVQDAVTRLRLVPVMFELGARPHPARQVYRAYLAQSQIFIGVYWQRYGWAAPGEPISGLEDEYLLSAGMPRLIYVKSPAPDRDPRLAKMLARIENDGAVSYQQFSSAAELQHLVENDLAVLLSERFEATQPQQQEDGLAGALPTPATALVDREHETSAVVNLVCRQGVRLVALTGPGGVGKSRLAVQAAARLSPELRDGARFVNLGSVPDARPGPGGDRYRPRAGHVGWQAEHPPPLVPAVQADPPGAGQLRAGPRGGPAGRRATERRPRAGSPGDQPDRPPAAWRAGVSGDPPLGPAGRAGAEPRPPRALRLGAAVPGAGPGRRPGLRADERKCLGHRANLPPARRPAAGYRAGRGPGQAAAPAALLARLDDRMDVLTGGAPDLPERQRTLRNTLDWSFSLLSADERALFPRLGVFAGSFGLPAAEAVCGGAAGPVMDTMGSLVDSSLVRLETRVRDDEPRFRLLETVGEYALERLCDSGDWAALTTGMPPTSWPSPSQPRPSWATRGSSPGWTPGGPPRQPPRGTVLAGGYRPDGPGRAADLGDLAVLVAARARRRAHALPGEDRGQQRRPGSASAGPGSGGTGFTLLADGDQASARPLLEESLPLYRQAGDTLGAGLVAAALAGSWARAATARAPVNCSSRPSASCGTRTPIGSTGDSACCTGWTSPWSTTSWARSGWTTGITTTRCGCSPTASPPPAARPTGSAILISLYDLALTSQARGDLAEAARRLDEGLGLAAEAGDQPSVA